MRRELILCAFPGCLVRFYWRRDWPMPALCPEHACTCLRPESLLGCGDRAQARRLYEAARAECEAHA